MMIIKNIFKIILSIALMAITLASLLLTVGAINPPPLVIITGMVSMLMMLITADSIDFKK